MQSLMISLFAYFFGAIPFGFLIGKFYGKDIRLEGSGNIGATNVTRVIGPAAGKICFALDFIKGYIPVAIAAHTGSWGMLLAGILAVAGHMFPVYLNFKGGKGVSTAGGAAVAMCPAAFLIAGAVWVAVFLYSRYVSLASIIAAAALPLSATVLMLAGRPFGGVPVLVFFYVIGAAAIWKHRANITRLRNGTELRFVRKK